MERKDDVDPLDKSLGLEGKKSKELISSMMTIDESTEGQYKVTNLVPEQVTQGGIQQVPEASSEEETPKSISHVIHSARTKIKTPLGSDGKTFGKFKQLKRDQSSKYLTSQGSQGGAVDDFSSVNDKSLGTNNSVRKVIDDYSDDSN